MVNKNIGFVSFFVFFIGISWEIKSTIISFLFLCYFVIHLESTVITLISTILSLHQVVSTCIITSHILDHVIKRTRQVPNLPILLLFSLKIMFLRLLDAHKFKSKYLFCLESLWKMYFTQFIISTSFLH